MTHWIIASEQKDLLVRSMANATYIQTTFVTKRNYQTAFLSPLLEQPLQLELFLSPSPQLLSQLRIIRKLACLSKLPKWDKILSRHLRRQLLTRCTIDIRIRSLISRDIRPKRIQQLSHRPAQWSCESRVLIQIRVYIPRVQRHAPNLSFVFLDTLWTVQAVEFLGVQDVPKLRLAVPCPEGAFLLVDIREVYSFLWGEVVAHAGDVDDSYVAWLGCSCCRQEQGKKVVSEQSVGEVVCLPLRFIAISGFGEGDSHYAGVVDEAVELLLFGGEFLCCRDDGREVHVVEDEEVEFGGGDLSFDGGDCGIAFCGSTTADIYGCVLQS